MTEKQIEKYIIPFYLKADLLANEQKSILTELLNSPDYESILVDFITAKGWRNRVVGSTIIGGLKMEKYIDQIFSQAKEFSEYHQAKSYAFALTNMNSKKADSYMKNLAETKLDSDYSKNLQKYYQAGLCIRNIKYKPEIDLVSEIYKLNSRIEKWKNIT
ncbi:hypothetical protein ACJRPK_05400 [Aquimarina sp. 2-A2]|uniref:hypothetical protein n=1 Tax=Aquimarina sp. 2-A2 TaxID=3382644 RepID=UPI00387F2E63